MQQSNHSESILYDIIGKWKSKKCRKKSKSIYTIFNNKEKKVLNLSVFSSLNFFFLLADKYLFRRKRLILWSEWQQKSLISKRKQMSVETRLLTSPPCGGKYADLQPLCYWVLVSHQPLEQQTLFARNSCFS